MGSNGIYESRTASLVDSTHLEDVAVKRSRLKHTVDHTYATSQLEIPNYPTNERTAYLRRTDI